jgi:hypothetical protein
LLGNNLIKFLLFFLLVFSNVSLAALKDGIFFSDKVTVDGKDLVLNGIGIRRATIFKFKVYYGGLYIEHKSNDPASFLNSKSPKQIVMNFVRDVDSKKLKTGFSDGLEAANKNYHSFTLQMDKFNSSIEDLVKGDKIIITFLQDGLQLNVKGKLKEKIIGGDFSQAVFNIWFINPGDSGLRDGLLSL